MLFFCMSSESLLRSRRPGSVMWMRTRACQKDLEESHAALALSHEETTHEDQHSSPPRRRHVSGGRRRVNRCTGRVRADVARKTRSHHRPVRPRRRHRHPGAGAHDGFPRAHRPDLRRREPHRSERVDRRGGRGQRGAGRLHDSFLHRVPDGEHHALRRPDESRSGERSRAGELAHVHPAGPGRASQRARAIGGAAGHARQAPARLPQLRHQRSRQHQPPVGRNAQAEGGDRSGARPVQGRRPGDDGADERGDRLPVRHGSRRVRCAQIGPRTAAGRHDGEAGVRLPGPADDELALSRLRKPCRRSACGASWRRKVSTRSAARRRSCTRRSSAKSRSTHRSSG